MKDEPQKAAERLRELARDPIAAPYLVGYLLASLDERHYPDLAQAALLYRERFGTNRALGRPAAHPTVEDDERWLIEQRIWPRGPIGPPFN